MYIICWLKIIWRDDRPYMNGMITNDNQCECSYDTPNDKIASVILCAMVILVELRVYLKRMKKNLRRHNYCKYCFVFTTNLIMELYVWVSPFTIGLVMLYNGNSSLQSLICAVFFVVVILSFFLNWTRCFGWKFKKKVRMMSFAITVQRKWAVGTILGFATYCYIHTDLLYYFSFPPYHFAERQNDIKNTCPKCYNEQIGFNLYTHTLYGLKYIFNYYGLWASVILGAGYKSDRLKRSLTCPQKFVRVIVYLSCAIISAVLEI